MIRINLLPRAQRRRRLRLRPGAVSAAAMVLGWALVTGLGYAWVAGHSAQAAELKAETERTAADTRALEKKRDNPALAERQRVLRIQQDGLRQLRAERRAPAAALGEIAALFGVGDARGEPGDPTPAAVRLLELRAEGPGTWRIDATAPDIADLAAFVRRVRASGDFNLSYGPEYARADDGSLRFRVDLQVVARQ